ncbi:MAG: NAD-dependent epimerase/dehydratase family protein [Planctomycetota bacterium]
MRVLLLGASGFLGRHLTHALLAAGDDVEGWSRTPPPVAPHDDERGARVVQRTADLARPESYAEFCGPWDAAIFLAGRSVPGAHWDEREVERNVALWRSALEHLKRVRPGLRVVFLSSARVYAPATAPLREDAPLGATSAYGIAKELCEVWGRFHTRELDVQIARLFNQIGPGMPPGLLVPDLVQSIRAGNGTVALRGGDSRIDVLDARDGARAIAALLRVRAPAGSAWNVCSGTPRTVSELARGLMQRLGASEPLTFASAPPPPLCGVSDKLRAACDWKPLYSFDATLDWIAGATAASGSTPR